MKKNHDMYAETTDFSRREFLKKSSIVLTGSMAAGVFPKSLEAEEEQKAKKKLIWANLVHLGYNMWADRKVDSWTSDPDITENASAKPYLRCDQRLWDDIMKKMSEAKMNMVVIDLGEGICYKSHPEIAVKNSWSREKLRDELKKIRDLGLEPIPKLNFSAGHDTWLGIYHRMVSTPKYYEVCKNLINEVVELFDKPRFFHLGYDEEVGNGKYAYVVIRQNELWWHDFMFFRDAVEGLGVRPWIWSDFAWIHADEFYEKMPKSVVQSNWHYSPGSFAKYEAGEADKKSKVVIDAYVELSKCSYDQIPTGSNFVRPQNFPEMVDFCMRRINDEHLLGFLQTPWVATLEVFRGRHMQAIEIVAETIAKYA